MAAADEACDVLSAMELASEIGASEIGASEIGASEIGASASAASEDMAVLSESESESETESWAAAARAAATDAAAAPQLAEDAKSLLKQVGATPEDREGLQSLQNLSLSMGLPAARACFRMMLEANGAAAPLRAWANRQIDGFSPVTEVGCLQVDYYDTVARKPAVARILLEECDRDHDFGAQLGALRARVGAEKWVEVVKHVSMLVHLGRSVYAQLAEANRPLIRKMYGRPASHDCAAEMKLGVDSRNTTLFVDPRWPRRIGVFVHLE